MPDTKIGEVTHHFSKISVAVLDLSHSLHRDESIRIVGKHTDFQQRVTSMQVDHAEVEEGHPGQEIAIKVVCRVRPGDVVYLREE
ncbi:MAG: hypothetical protein R6U92_05510 [Bacillota bacterium]